jgi:alpha-beta hydrolase superfamily lysophospholipase
MFDNANARVRSLSTPEGHIAYRDWSSDKVVGVVIHLHGIESHSGWVSETAQTLSEQGYRVYAPDRLGSGLSEGLRGDAPSWRVWSSHARSLVEIAQTENPGVPLFLSASCWGAKVALEVAIGSPERISGLALIAPALKPRVNLDFSRRLQVAAAMALWPEKPFEIPIKQETMFTEESPYCDLIRWDDLRLKEATARFLYESRKLDRHILRRLRDLKVPTLVFLAGRDEIVDTPTVRASFERLCPDHVTLRTFSSACHSMEFGRWRQPLTKELVTWLSNHCVLESLTQPKTKKELDHDQNSNLRIPNGRADHRYGAA